MQFVSLGWRNQMGSGGGGGAAPDPSDWILAAGAWDDAGIWIDGETWKDAP